MTRRTYTLADLFALIAELLAPFFNPLRHEITVTVRPISPAEPVPPPPAAVDAPTAAPVEPVAAIEPVAELAAGETAEALPPVGLVSYYPEMGDEKPAAEIEASLSHYGKHWYLWTPLELKGRGIVKLETEATVDHRRAGWHRYKVTERAFDLLGKKHRIASASML